MALPQPFGRVLSILSSPIFAVRSPVIWAFTQARWSLPRATLWVVATLGVIEYLQIYLAGHQPESTDLALALLGAFLIAMMSRGQIKRGYAAR